MAVFQWHVAGWLLYQQLQPGESYLEESFLSFSYARKDMATSNKNNWTVTLSLVVEVCLQVSGLAIADSQKTQDIS